MDEKNFIIQNLLQENAQLKVTNLKLEFALRQKEELNNADQENTAIAEEASTDNAN